MGKSFQLKILIDSQIDSNLLNIKIA